VRWLAALLGISCGDGGGGEDCYQRTFWPDQDGDGYGSFSAPLSACELPEGASQNSDDCDDADPNVHPGAVEVCDDKDGNCDGVGDTPEGTWYTDADGDGYGNGGMPQPACTQPQGTVADGTDCNDTDPDMHPGVPEVCDGDDDNCDGRPDLGYVAIWYTDEDGDGYGDASEAVKTCDPDPSWVNLLGDCDPANANAHPGANEVCNAYDDDCDGQMLFCGYSGEYLLADAPTKLTGDHGDDAGRLVDAGDLDGDGDEEIVVATLYASGYNGGGYIVDGPPPLGTGELSDGIQVEGSSDTYGAGRSIGTGDANGDGLQDVVFGAPYAPGGNEAFVIFGPISATMDLEDADVDLQGDVASSYTGHGSDLGDVNGDGIADATIGAYNTNGGKGTIYVVYGPLDEGTFDLGDADGIHDATVGGGYCGRVVRSGLDMTGDGLGEILAPAPYASVGGPSSGMVNVIEGPADGDSDLDDAYAVLQGAGPNALAGQDVAQGDVDGDGRADAIVGSPYAGAGSVAWVSGDRSGDIDLNDADGILTGHGSGAGFGMNVDAKDIDGDGRAELLIGAPSAPEGAASGAVYLFYTPIEGDLDTDDAGALWIGEHSNDELGTGVAFADFDGDSSTDIVIGAPSERAGGSQAGAIYLWSPDPK
jgi:hypothetical protein